MENEDSDDRKHAISQTRPRKSSCWSCIVLTCKLRCCVMKRHIWVMKRHICVMKRHIWVELVVHRAQVVVPAPNNISTNSTVELCTCTSSIIIQLCTRPMTTLSGVGASSCRCGRLKSGARARREDSTRSCGYTDQAFISTGVDQVLAPSSEYICVVEGQITL